jgi:hypothetical protein
LKGEDFHQILANRASGSPKKIPKFEMTLRVWLPQHTPMNPPITQDFGNSGDNPLTCPGQEFLVVPLEYFFLDPPITAHNNAVDLVPSPHPVPQQYNPVWSVDLFDLQQRILKKALLDGLDGKRERPMTYSQ